MAANKKIMMCGVGLVIYLFICLFVELEEKEWQGQTLNFIGKDLFFVIVTS